MSDCASITTGASAARMDAAALPCGMAAIN